MRSVQSVIFRSLSFLLVGILMIAFPDKISAWLVMTIGILFLIPGLVSIATFFKAYTKGETSRVLLPVVGIGSVVLGLFLLLMPETFKVWLMYVLAAALLLVGIMGVVNILHFRKYVHIGVGYYVIPTLLCVAGLFVLLHPMKVAEDAIKILGVANIVYALTELVYTIRFRKVYRMIANESKKAEASPETETVEDTPEIVDQTTEPEPAEESPAEGEAEAPAEETAENEPSAGSTIDFTQDAGPRE